MVANGLLGAAGPEEKVDGKSNPDVLLPPPNDRETPF